MNNEINNQVTNQMTNEVNKEIPAHTKQKSLKQVFNTKVKLDSKNKKLVVILLVGFIVVFAIVLIIASQKSNLNMLNGGTEEVVKVDTGVQWGNLYAEFMQKEMVDITSYDVSLADLNNDGTPEMLVEYIDAEEKKDLKIFYIYEGEVFTTKIFRTYSLCLLYSVETKEVGWYIYISSNGTYGAYTSLEKIVNGVAYDSDIKANNADLVEEFGKKYVKGDYKLVFYQVNTESFEEDVKNVVSRYDGYKEKINKAINTMKDNYSDREYVDTPESDPNNEYIIFSGNQLYYGKYQYIDEHGTSSYIYLNNAYTVVIDDSYVTYKIVDGNLVLSDETVISVPGNNKLRYSDRIYVYVPEEDTPVVDVPENNQDISESVVDDENNDNQQTVVEDNSNNEQQDGASSEVNQEINGDNTQTNEGENTN